MKNSATLQHNVSKKPHETSAKFFLSENPYISFWNFKYIIDHFSFPVQSPHYEAVAYGPIGIWYARPPDRNQSVGRPMPKHAAAVRVCVRVPRILYIFHKIFSSLTFQCLRFVQCAPSRPIWCAEPLTVPTRAIERAQHLVPTWATEGAQSWCVEEAS